MSSIDINRALIRPINPQSSIASPLKQSTNSTASFNELLTNSMNNNDVKFSKHAESRLASRNISLSKDQKSKLSDAVTKANQKGIRDSLIMMDNIALVVNVKSRTVITAMDNNEAKENIFTNIDGAILV